MKQWIRSTAAALVLAAPAAAQNASGVSVWLQLPKNAELSAPGRVQGANARIIKLLGPDAATATFTKEEGLLVHYTAAAWSLQIPPDKRRADLSMLAADWGAALRVDGEPSIGTPAFLNAVPETTHKIPTIDSVLSLVPSSLLAGDPAGAFDGAKTYQATIDAVSGRPGAALSRPTSPPIRTDPFAPQSEAARAPSPFAEPYEDLIMRAAHASGIAPDLLRAVIYAKSGLQADRASSGAYGLMGISARNAKAYGYTSKQILDPAINLKVGSDMLAGLLKEFDGDVHRALAAYQIGPVAVLRSGGIPNDRDVKDFMGAVERALGPAARAASLPVKTIHRPMKDSAHLDMIELAEQIRKIPGVARYRPLIEKTAEQFGVDPKLMEAIVMQEDSSGDPRATSPKGAQGLAQLMPDTAAQLGVTDAYDPAQSLRGMARHLKHLSKVFNGDQVLIAASYNAGEGTVQRLGRVPRVAETKAYVRRVFNNYFTLTGEKVDVEPYMPPKRPKP